MTVGVVTGQLLSAKAMPMLAAESGILGRLTQFALDAIERFNYFGIGFLGTYGKWVGMDEEDVTRANTFFAAHGGKAVFLFRLIPLGRSLISIPAGFTQMPIGPFLLYSALGSGLWNGFLISLGWFAGDNWEQIEGYLKPFEYLGIVALAFALVVFVVRRRGQMVRQTNN